MKGQAKRRVRDLAIASFRAVNPTNVFFASDAASAVATPTQKNNSSIPKLSDASQSPSASITLAGGTDAQSETAANVEHIGESVIEVREALPKNFAEGINPSAFETPLVISVHPSEPEVVIYTAEKDQSTPASGTVFEPVQSLNDEVETKASESSEAEHVSGNWSECFQNLL